MDNSHLVIGMSGVEYISLGKNRGIATAMNIGYRRAAELGASWVLTMDQDSSFSDEDIKNYLTASRSVCPTTPIRCILFMRHCAVALRWLCLIKVYQLIPGTRTQPTAMAWPMGSMTSNMRALRSRYFYTTSSTKRLRPTPVSYDSTRSVHTTSLNRPLPFPAFEI